MAAPTFPPSQAIHITEDIASCILQFVERKDLHAFCLVNRTFHVAGLPYLYRDLKLGARDRWRKGYLKRDILICHTLARQPYLAFYVHDLSLDLSWPLEPHPVFHLPQGRWASAICRLYFRALYSLKNLKSLHLHVMPALGPLVPNFLHCSAQLASFTFTTTLNALRLPPLDCLIDLLKQPLFTLIQQLSIETYQYAGCVYSDRRFVPVLHWLKTNPSELTNLTRINCTLFPLNMTFSEAASGRPVRTFRSHHWCRDPSEWQGVLKNLSESTGPLLHLGIRCSDVSLAMISDIPRYLPNLVELVMFNESPQNIESTYTNTTGRAVQFNALKSLVVHLSVGGRVSATRDQVNPFYAWKIISPLALVFAAGTPSLSSISTNERWTIPDVDENTGEEEWIVLPQRSEYRKVRQVWTCNGQALPIEDAGSA